jgi:hypothetical protein
MTSRRRKNMDQFNPKPRVVLAKRENGGIRATLLWKADANPVAVLVRDGSTDDQFELLVEPELSPIDVYEHPHAYAAWRGIDYRAASLRAAA